MLKEMKFNQSSYQNTQGSNLSIILQSVKGFHNFKVREKLHLDKKNKYQNFYTKANIHDQSFMESDPTSNFCGRPCLHCSCSVFFILNFLNTVHNH